MLTLGIMGFAREAAAELPAGTKLAVSAIAGAATDYAYRGVSLTAERPTGFLFLEATYGSFYFNGFVAGTELGDDALGRSIGSVETDATFGFAPTIDGITYNLGAKYTGYPKGRDLVAGTLTRRERDYIEYFAGAKAPLTDRFLVGGTIFWTPDFYYETGSVWTMEAQAALTLPPFWGIQSRLTSHLGRVESDRPNVVAPGHSYAYFDAGIEGQYDRFVFDLRYWDTDVVQFDAFDRRLVLAVGIKLE